MYMYRHRLARLFGGYLFDDPYPIIKMASFNEQLLENARPNFFELVATEAMQEALRPAFQYICKVNTV